MHTESHSSARDTSGPTIRERIAAVLGYPRLSSGGDDGVRAWWHAFRQGRIGSIGRVLIVTRAYYSKQMLTMCDIGYKNALREAGAEPERPLAPVRHLHVVH